MSNAQRIPLLVLTLAVVSLLAVVSSAARAVTYQLGPETDLLDASFYAGQPEDGSNVAGRMGFFGAPSRDGKTVAFWAVNAAKQTHGTALFLVDIGDPSSWRRLTDDLWNDPTELINWTPDNLSIITRRNLISVATGARSQLFLCGYDVFELCMTSRMTGNWGVTEIKTNPEAPGNSGDDFLAIPILANAQEDPARAPVFLTNIGHLAEDIDWPILDANMDRLIFLHQTWTGWTNSWVPGNVLELVGIQDILAAPKIPGTDISSEAANTLGDPRIISIENGLNLAAPSGFSADGTLVFYCEEWNRRYIIDQFFETIPLSDFDIMIAEADGSGGPTRLAQPGNQAMAVPTPGGTRLVFMKDVGGIPHLFVSTLEVATEISGTIEGDEADNDIRTDSEQQASDASGTLVVVPEDIVIDFPVSEPQEIQITTPIDSATEPQLPEGIDAIPVIRKFGPAGTTFSVPITITITYTDAQVAGLDEANLRLFEYNEVTGQYDLEVTTITNRDLVNNTISFTVTHFSVFGLGGSTDTDQDGISDDTDPDDDGDGVPDGEDAYPLDTDDDGLDNAVDPDDDSDGMPDGDDLYPLDTDNDGLPNDVDADDDADGISDEEDLYPFDTDNDGRRNDVDTDDDNDRLSDYLEIYVYHTNPLDTDSDDDGLADSVEVTFGFNPLVPDPDVTLPLQTAIPTALGLLVVAIVRLARSRRRLEM